MKYVCKGFLCFFITFIRNLTCLEIIFCSSASSTIEKHVVSSYRNLNVTVKSAIWVFTVCITICTNADWLIRIDSSGCFRIITESQQNDV